MEDQKTNKFIVPIAIILAGVIIGGAIFYDKKTPPTTTSKDTSNEEQQANISASPLNNVKQINDSDHFLGSSNAPVSIVTFTDLECPFCKRFHITMKQIMDEYGKTGKVKWILRAFPLAQLHSRAKKEAVAAECAADLGGNDIFWKYIDRIFEITPGNNGLNPLELPRAAEYVGLDKTQFTNCLNSGKFDERIEENIENAIKSGALGTPYSVVVGSDGKKIAIPGALPYLDVKKIIDEALK